MRVHIMMPSAGCVHGISSTMQLVGGGHDELSNGSWIGWAAVYLRIALREAIDAPSLESVRPEVLARVRHRAKLQVANEPHGSIPLSCTALLRRSASYSLAAAELRDEDDTDAGVLAWHAPAAGRNCTCSAAIGHARQRLHQKRHSRLCSLVRSDSMESQTQPLATRRPRQGRKSAGGAQDVGRAQNAGAGS